MDRNKVARQLLNLAKEVSKRQAANYDTQIASLLYDAHEELGKFNFGRAMQFFNMARGLMIEGLKHNKFEYPESAAENFKLLTKKIVPIVKALNGEMIKIESKRNEVLKILSEIIGK